MPPPAKLRPVVEEMIHDGATPKEIAAHAEAIGFGREYAMQIYRGLTTIATACSGQFPDRDDHYKHLRALRDANGYGFTWWPPSLMERVYLLEKSPPRAPAFWRGEQVVRGVA